MTRTADELTAPIRCPKCAHEFEQSMSRLKDDPLLACPSCGEQFKIESGGTARNVVDQLDKLDRLFDKISKG